MKIRATSAAGWRHVKFIGTALVVAAVATPIVLSLRQVEDSSAVVGTNYLGGNNDGSDLLRIAISDSGGANPQRYNANGDCSLTPGSDGSCWTREYFAGDGNGLVFYANGQVMFWGGNNGANFGTKSGDVNITVSNSYLSHGAEVIERTWTGTGPASGIVLQEAFTLPEGSAEYFRSVTIRNNTGAPLTDARLIVGGDTYFAGDDRGYTGLVDSTSMVYVYKDNVHGAMFFSGSDGTPADKYYAGSYSTGYRLAKNDAMLDNSISGSITRVDTSYYLQWGDGSVDLAAGQTRTISMSETITDATSSNIQIVAPAISAVSSDSTANLTFRILSLSTDAMNLDSIDIESESGWTATVTPTSSTMQFGDVLEAEVSLQVPAGVEANSIEELTLSVSFIDGTESASTKVIVDPIAPTITEVNPSMGTTGGGYEVTIVGTGFSEMNEAFFGNNAAAIRSVTPTQMTVVVPAGAEGLVDVRVTNPFTSPAISDDAFEYIQANWVTENVAVVGSDTELTYRISRDVSLVDEVRINGIVLDAEIVAEIVSGDASHTLVTLPGELISNLETADYTLTVIYTDGFTATDSFRIVLAVDVPNTGLGIFSDGGIATGAVIGVGLAIVSIVAFSGYTGGKWFAGFKKFGFVKFRNRK